MKKFMALLAAAILLTSCGSSTPSTQNSREEDFVFAQYNKSNSTEGMYYFAPTDSQGNGRNVLNYVDFDTCNNAVVCPLPNCPHTDPKSCYALGVGNGTAAIVPIGDSIYWTRIEDDGRTYLYTAKKDGTDRKRAAELPKQTGGDALVYYQNKLYFVGEDSPLIEIDEDGGITEKGSGYLMYYDFDAKETVECVNMGELYPRIDSRMTAGMSGCFDKKIYAYAMSDSVAPAYFTYDLTNGEVEKTDFKPLQFEGGYMIFSGPRLVSPDGTELKFDAPDNAFYGYRVVGDKFFTRAYVYDIPSGKRYKNLVSDIIVGPILYKDGSFLILDWEKNTFKWLDEKKVIGAEMK